MKKIFINTLVVVTLFTVLNIKTEAAQIGASNMGREYLVNSDPLENWSFGIFGGSGERGVKMDKGGDQTLDINRGMVYVGYDLLSWITPYVAVGITDSSIGATASDSTKFSYGIGANLNLINQEIMDPFLMADVFRINADVYFNGSQTDTTSDTITWGEFKTSITASLMNDTTANHSYFPIGIGIYAGPMYSYYISSDFEAKDSFGLIAGLSMFFTKRTSFEISAELIDETTVNGSLNIRF